MMNTTRRTALGLLTASALALTAALPAMAQDIPKLRFSAVFSEQDIRAEMMQRLQSDVAEIAEVELFYGGNLFKQGTEIIAIQRGNLEMGNVAPSPVK